ncbi:MAG TPA: hypothetical protein VF178_15320 [Gemmatimonadaceae bacterium]
MRYLLLVGLTTILASACRSARPAMPAVLPAVEAATSGNGGACADCNSPLGSTELAQAVERRVVELKARGGSCAVYAEVLERSYRSGQITVRPYMWREGRFLVSGEAKPNGEMVLAREIDSLNVGVRTIDDLLWTMEHEAAHIAFNISNGADAADDLANTRVRECR